MINSQSNHEEWLKFLYFKYGQREIPQYDIEVKCDDILYRDCPGVIDEKPLYNEEIESRCDDLEFQKKWLLCFPPLLERQFGIL